jgi:rsbT antagonist protein RsbS
MYEATMFRLGDTIVVPIQVELHDRAAHQLQQDVFQKIVQIGAKGLIIDVSAIYIVDSFLGRLLGETGKTARLLGAETVLVGLKKEVVITLIELGLSITELRTARNLEDGLALLKTLQYQADHEAEGSGRET